SFTTPPSREVASRASPRVTRWSSRWCRARRAPPRRTWFASSRFDRGRFVESSAVLGLWRRAPHGSMGGLLFAPPPARAYPCRAPRSACMSSSLARFRAPSRAFARRRVYASTCYVKGRNGNAHLETTCRPRRKTGSSGGGGTGGEREAVRHDLP